MKNAKLVVAPTAELLTIEECRSHLEAQVYNDSEQDALDDAMILALLGAAREYCEAFLGLTLAPCTWEIAYDTFPAGAIELPRGPVRSLVSITVGDVTNSSSSDDYMLAPESYVLDTHSLVPRVVPVTTWPTVTSATNTIRIQYRAGYGEESSDLTEEGQPLPYAVRAAMLLMLGHVYANREAVVSGPAVTTLPLGVEALLRPLRVRLGMA